MAVDVVGQILSALVWILILGVILIGGVVLVMMSQYKHKVRVRQVVKGRTIIKDDRGKITKDRKGVEWFKLMKHKKKLPLPPSDCLDITEKGKPVIEYYLTEDGAFVPIKDSFDYKEFKEEHAETFQPLTTQERSLMLNEYDIADSYKKKDWNDTVKQLVVWGVPIMLLALILIFGGELFQAMQGVVDAANQAVSAANSCKATSLVSEAVNQTIPN